MFTGKATYDGGAALPEICEDVSDIVGIVGAYETPLLDHFGDPHRVARSTYHEWLEDALIPNTDTISAGATFSAPLEDSLIEVDHVDRFNVGDLVQVKGSQEVMLVNVVTSSAIVVTRGYGGTTAEALAAELELLIIGGAALEGDDRPVGGYTNRVRKSNWTQIFTAGVEVSGTQLAVSTIGIADELDYQKTERLRELLRDLENCVINGVAPTSTQEGSSTVRRSMNGILAMIDTNAFEPGESGFPDGDGTSSDELTELQINTALREIWEQSAAQIDTIVVSGLQKRRINGFITSGRSFDARETRYRDLVSTYESDFGVCRVVLSRWVPADTVLLLDSSRIDVLPLSGRSFQYKADASGGDREAGQVVGEYTVEFRNENAHGVIRGLGT